MKTSILTFRDSTQADEPLLFRLFAENKARAFAALPLGKEQLQPLLAMQYRARCASYVSAYPGARQIVVEEESNPVGHVLLSEDETTIHIVDLAIAPAHHARGLGTAVLRAIQEQAAGEDKELRLQVVPDSPASTLYARLEFVVTACDPMLNEMVWLPKRKAEVAPA